MKTAQRILIQLDALLDTRVGTAYRLGSTELDWKGYFERTHSKVWEFFGLPKEEFEEAYLRRNLETLEFSRATELFKQLPFVLRNKFVAAASAPLFDRPELVINYWPYNLSPIASAHIQRAIFDVFPENFRVRVSMVYKSTELLTARYLKDNYTDYILYDLTEWLEYNNRTFDDVLIPEVTITYPGTLNHEDITKFAPMGEHDDPFTNIQMLLSPVVGLNAISPNLLSLDSCLLLRDDPDE